MEPIRITGDINDPHHHALNHLIRGLIMTQRHITAGLIVFLAFFSANTLLAETRTYVMPDGSKTVVEIPPGMTYTEEDAIKAWKSQRISQIQETQRRARSSDELSKDTAVPKRRLYKDTQKVRDIILEREETTNEHLKAGKDSINSGDRGAQMPTSPPDADKPPT